MSSTGKAEVPLFSDIYESGIFPISEGMRPGGLRLTDHLIKSCSFKGGERLLDAGCGSGVTLDYISRNFSLETTGIDLLPSLLKNGHERFPSLRLVRGDASHLPFADSSFDCVIAECSLSVMEDTAGALGEFSRVLSGNGKLVISDVYLRNSVSAESMSTLRINRCVSGAFIRDELESMLNDTGFRIVVWEDHSDLWREFIAGLILSNAMQHDSFSCLFTATGERDILDPEILKAKPGYFSLMAEKIS